MKLFIGIVSFVFGISAFAAPSMVRPTVYNCTGAGNTSIGYTTTSFAGKPTFNVAFKGEEGRVAGQKINFDNSRIGNLVSVSDFHMVPVDGPEVRYTLILPNVSLANTSEHADFNAMLVRTSVANPFFHSAPGAFTGTIENNDFAEVNCRAEFVVF